MEKLRNLHYPFQLYHEDSILVCVLNLQYQRVKCYVFLSLRKLLNLSVRDSLAFYGSRA